VPAANPAAKPLDNACHVRTTLEYRPSARTTTDVLDDVPTATDQMVKRCIQKPEPCPPRARQESHPRRFTVIHGKSSSALDLCSRRSSGRVHLLCKQGVRVRVPYSTRQNTRR
jgi:hypothetical protein